MERRPLHRPRRLRIRRLSWRFAVLAGAVAALSVLAWPASATSGATCDAATHTVTVASGQTATIVRSGNSVTVPGCGGTGSVLGPIGGGGVKVDTGGGDDSVSTGGSPGTGAASEIAAVVDGGSGVNTLDFSLAAGPVTANLFQGTASGARNVVNFSRILGSPFNDDLVGDHDNYI